MRGRIGDNHGQAHIILKFEASFFYCLAADDVTVVGLLWLDFFGADEIKLLAFG